MSSLVSEGATEKTRLIRKFSPTIGDDVVIYKGRTYRRKCSSELVPRLSYVLFGSIGLFSGFIIGGVWGKDYDHPIIGGVVGFFVGGGLGSITHCLVEGIISCSMCCWKVVECDEEQL